MTTVLDLAEKVVALATEKPDYVYDSGVVNERGYPRCLYLDPNDQTKGSCLVGQAAIACGISPDVLHRYENESAHMLLDGLLDEGYLDGGDEDLERAIDSTQSFQDEKTPWGRAVEESGLAHNVRLTKKLRALKERESEE